MWGFSNGFHTGAYNYGKLGEKIGNTMREAGEGGGLRAVQEKLERLKREKER
ncbi:MAG: hypothetical protein ACE5JL_06745 [Dehalococcoidia bacterium]